MVAFNFQRQFVDAIRSGAKTQTIRRNARCETGDTLQLYTGQRTKNCVLIGTAVCTICEPIKIAEDYVSSGGWRLPSGDAHHIARIDGFASLEAMRDWFRERYGLPFEGYRVMWTGFNASHAYAIAEPLGEGVTPISKPHTTTEEGE
jgi:hypothetical protein